MYGLAITGSIIGAAAPLTSRYNGDWIFGPNHEAKNVFYNGSLAHSTQQLYMSTGMGYEASSCICVSLLMPIVHRLVYTAKVLAGSIPAPPPILPNVPFPKFAAQGIAQREPKVIETSISKNGHQPSKGTADEKRADSEFDQLLARSFSVDPGSSEADEYMSNLMNEITIIAKAKSCTGSSLLARIAKAHWKQRQGAFC